MSAKSLHCLSAGAAVLLSLYSVTGANAQCCGGAPTTAYYQPAAYTAYSPVAYQSYNSGWYPGYFLDRIRTRLWGSPSTYVAAYPSTYVASYPTAHYASYPTYSAGYATYAPAVSSCSTCSTHTAGYAPAYASPCSTCVQQVTMRPVCATSCAPVCETCTPSCDSCGTSGVSQASYQQSSGCATCGNGGQAQQSNQGGTTIVVPNGTVLTPGSQQAPSYDASQPTLDPNADVSPRSTFQRPVEESEQPIVPEPQNDPTGDELDKVLEGGTTDGSTYFEAPRLFNPKDRTAQRHIAPVRTAVYDQPVGYHRASTVRTKITAEQAAQDAVGWTSASN